MLFDYEATHSFILTYYAYVIEAEVLGNSLAASTQWGT